MPHSLDGRIVRYVLSVCGVVFSVLSAHLHSRIRDQDELRRLAADVLWSESRDRKSRTPYVVVIGDMNEEPYEQSVLEMLNTSRSQRVCIRAGRLYNPSWRFLHDADDRLGGTSLGRDKRAVWKAFDQVVLSSALLRRNSEIYFAGRCEVVEPPGHMARTDGRAVRVLKHFDHLPIVVQLEVRYDRYSVNSRPKV
ncbi:MAG: hypothetical protein FWD57_05270 [Polyangiaceae bacterium]|nr:hypothetical protein [Polyangiaceae bacterium]